MAVKYNLEDLKDLYVPDWKAVRVSLRYGDNLVTLLDGDTPIFIYRYKSLEELKVVLAKFKKFVLERQKEQAIERAKIEAAATRKPLKK